MHTDTHKFIFRRIILRYSFIYSVKGESPSGLVAFRVEILENDMVFLVLYFTV